METEARQAGEWQGGGTDISQEPRSGGAHRSRLHRPSVECTSRLGGDCTS